jgi:DNA-binding NtrC family response regulator
LKEGEFHYYNEHKFCKMPFQEDCVAKILITEDHPIWGKLLNGALGEEHDLEFVNFSRLKEELDKKLYDLALVDMELELANGVTIMQVIREQSPETKVIIISASNKIEDAVEAVKKGADDFIIKPFTAEKLRLAIEHALENKSLKNEIDYLRRNQDTIYDLNKITAKSPAMRRVIEVIRKVSKTDSTILMTGETGTGKSFLAGSLHFNSGRRSKPFVKIFCANMPETLLDSEFFGHEKGSFTGANKTRIGRFEQANGGTVFLDEIGDISVSLQSKLLRVLEEKEFERLGGNKTIHTDIRVISATNKNLEKAIERGDFREDLYYRINVLQVSLPPLRERIEDIEDLAYYLLDKHCLALHKKIDGFPRIVLEMFKNYPWPGNIRQMSNAIERAVLLTEGRIIEEHHIVLGGIPNAPVQAPPEVPEQKPSWAKPLVDHEKQVILDALGKSLWIQKDAAELLGISRRVLNYKIKNLGIKHPRWRKNI